MEEKKNDNIEVVEKTPEQLKQENNMNFAVALKNEVGSIDQVKTTERRRKVETSRVQTALNDPLKNAIDLQQQSEYLRVINGTLKEIQFYKSNILTFDHFLVPVDASKYKNKNKYFKDMRKACLELEKYNLKTLCPWLIETQLRMGEIYIYKQAGTDEITFFKMPNDICKISHSKSFMNGYSIQLTGITEKTLPYFPKDIQDLYVKYRAGSLKNDENLSNGYYRLEIENAIAFTPEILETKGIPYYSGLLLDLSRIKDLADMNMENAESDNFKLVHQLLPSDKDTGEITIPYETAMQYHRAMKNELPSGVGGISTPYEISSVSLGGTSTSNYDYINTLRENLFNGSGVDSSLFNSDNKTTAQAIMYSGCIDTLLAKNLLDRIKIWLNYDFASNSALKNFRIVFCDSSVYDKDAKISAMATRLTTWASRLEYMALQGYSPLEAINILQVESQVNLDSMMKPLMTSHTASGMETGGRPTASESSGDINKGHEMED